MKLGKRNLVAATVMGAVLSGGMVSQASAGVYGLAYLNIDDLQIVTDPFITASLFTFSTNQDAVLNNATGTANGNDNCGGVFAVFNNCLPLPVSGPAQNPLANTAGQVRGDGDYTAFGQNGNYSNAEAEIIQAVLLGNADTHVAGISESRLVGGNQSAQADTSVTSNTVLSLTVGTAGAISLRFTADIDVRAEVTDVPFGLAQAASSATFSLVDSAGKTVVSWSPTGGLGSPLCAGVACLVVKDPLSLNFTATTFGIENKLTGTNLEYQLDISGLSVGQYSIALASTTNTDLISIPVPGSLLLVGTGLLLGARAAQRKKS